MRSDIPRVDAKRPPSRDHVPPSDWLRLASGAGYHAAPEGRLAQLVRALP
jgi:hypothetical protein